ncbi:TonB-dependent receptor domain-containing protein [Alterisphingorhabdus coralli]|uniref:TonB-dependent receptor n=1 Tax=Alterisphingorhabdus coralli TaxID=3071408 RepID=A0AA97I250_9SPHN|nr:TonB-dependent receptor [Parasphingorhabdus sp. SCSIO 66989]WOE75888.1 TonB-dependent receptor [Parasphingorhabdus sp. SCSIO 66989]
MKQLLPRYCAAQIAIAIALLSHQAVAQENPAQSDEPVASDSTVNVPLPPDDEDEQADIVVTGAQVRGAVVTEVPPIEELDAQDIESYGVASLGELLAVISPQTNSGRGRGSGRPAVLLNGRRISGFRELAQFPPEAIKRVQIFPEELALSYGFRPDQRVINFILVDDFSSFAMDGEYGIATQGGRGEGEIGATYTNIDGGDRIVLDIEYQGATALRESERNIVQPEFDPSLTTVDSDPDDASEFRTLLPTRQRFESSATFGWELSPSTSLTVNGVYGTEDTIGQNGLNAPIFDVDATNPFNTSGTDLEVLRLLNEPRTLLQQQDVETFQLSSSLNGRRPGILWSLTGDYERIETETRIDRLADTTGLQTAIDAGTLDPFSPVLGAGLLPPELDIARSVQQTFTMKGTATMRPLTLPTGDVQLTADGEFTDLSLSASDRTALGFSSSDLGRTIGAGTLNLEIPLADRNGVNSALGRLSINGNLGVNELSDFGTLTSFGYGLNWEFTPGWTLQASFIRTETAPTVGQLGNPLIVTPNVPIFDFTNNQTVLVDSISGGNADLLAEEQRDVKIGLTWRPETIDGLSIVAEFFRNRSFDTTAAFPTLTPEVEAAFPDRVFRDAAGNLTAVDQRPVNFARITSDSVRYGINYRKRWRKLPQGGFGGGRRGRGRQQGQGAGGPPQGGPTNAAGQNGGPATQAGGPPRGRPGGGGRRFRPRIGRWNISIFHRIRFTETVLPAPGIAEFDLLNGSSISGAGGVPRHSVELEGGWFFNGVGARVTADFEDGTRVDGVGGGDDSLDFNPIATVNLRAFINFDSRPKWTENMPFLKGARLSVRINNLFDAQQNVRDALGNVPLRFQPGFVDPLGRFIEIDIRKRF